MTRAFEYLLVTAFSIALAVIVGTIASHYLESQFAQATALFQ